MPKVKNPPAKAQADAWIERLKEAGFTVQTQDESRVRVSKHGCAAVIELSSSGEPQFAKRPGLLVRATAPSASPLRLRSGQAGPAARERANDLSLEQETSEAIAHLVDRGYQKFWQEGDRRLPALSAQLQALHQFEQDLRAAMGLTALYNEALGTVSSRYIYDRLEGREIQKRHHPF